MTRTTTAAAPVGQVPAGFTVCPAPFANVHAWQQALYTWAYQAAVSQSLFHVLERRYRVLGLG